MTHRAITEARACIEAFIEDAETDWLAKARRFVARAVDGEANAMLWTTAFAAATRDLELARLVDGDTSEPARECYRLMAVIEVELQ